MTATKCLAVLPFLGILLAPMFLDRVTPFLSVCGPATGLT